ncbi:LacI family DNA-binding transcriptional regulator [Massilia orientalis]|uniref:LacI family DNA-binding transcriptional regulator n=1 Tax=Massilia orientalis TaxID=3050128 RepID=A0ACC7MKI9_9BURK
MTSDKVTIRQVARLAGVGLGTASRVVGGKGAVSPAKAERVRKAIEELQFQPSHVARSLSRGTTQAIGVYIPVLSGTFYTPVLQIINAELLAAGVQMMVAFGSGDGDARARAMRGVEFLMGRGCDGMIGMALPLLDEDLAVLGKKRERIVILNHSLDAMRDRCFTLDHYFGGQLAARTLLEHSHREIAVIAGPSSLPDSVLRMEGFLDQLDSVGIDRRSMWIVESDFTAGGGWHAARALLDSGRRFTALFCANDEMAVGALSCFHSAGIRVPHDVSVIGYDDTPSADYSAPQLTSVHLPWREMTQNGVWQLLNLCYGLSHPVVHDFEIQVTQRSSVSSPGDVIHP